MEVISGWFGVFGLVDLLFLSLLLCLPPRLDSHYKCYENSSILRSISRPISKIPKLEQKQNKQRRYNKWFCLLPPQVQYVLEADSFDSVQELVRFYIGQRKPVSQSSGVHIYCPVSRTLPLRYLEATFALAASKQSSAYSPSSQRGAYIKRRSVTMNDGLTMDKMISHRWAGGVVLFSFLGQWCNYKTPAFLFVFLQFSWHFLLALCYIHDQWLRQSQSS